MGAWGLGGAAGLGGATGLGFAAGAGGAGLAEAIAGTDASATSGPEAEVVAGAAG